MLLIAQKIVREREAETLKWLKMMYGEAVRQERSRARCKLYGAAQNAASMAEAYSYVILHFERTMLPRRKRRPK